jgi:hypothetical protein
MILSGRYLHLQALPGPEYAVKASLSGIHGTKTNLFFMVKYDWKCCALQRKPVLNLGSYISNLRGLQSILLVGTLVHLPQVTYNSLVYF